MRYYCCCFLALLSALLLTAETTTPTARAAIQAPVSAEVASSPAQFWISGMGQDAFPPLLGDIDGDGRADVFRIRAAATARGQKTRVLVMRTSSLGKPRFPASASAAFGPRPLAFACGPFANREGRAEVAAVMTNGALQIAYGFQDSGTSAEKDTATPSISPTKGDAPRKQKKRRANVGAGSPQSGTDTPGSDDEEDEETDDSPEETLNGRDLFTQNTVAAVIPAALRPALPVRALVPGDFDGDGRTDLLLLDANGALLLLLNGTSDGKSAEPRFLVRSVKGTLPGVPRIAAGALGGVGTTAGDHRSRLVYLDAAGHLFRAVLRFDKNETASPELSPGVPLLAAGDTVSPAEPLAVGYFHTAQDRAPGAARGSADILVGKRLLIGGDKDKTLLLKALPSGAESKVYKDNAAPIVGDVDGNGRDDLLLVRRVESGIRLKERIIGDDAMVFFLHDPRRADDPVWSFVSTANDGLPDAWKTGKVKPNGYDLAALGCRVGRQSLIVEVQRVSDVPEAKVRAIMDQAVAYYASLPTTNPDGSHGISLHIIYREPIPAAESEPTTRRYPPAVRIKARAALAEKYHQGRSRGIAHWMRIKNDPGGVSKVMGEAGHATTTLHTFLHELGHQVGLGHDGGWLPHFSPLYPSLMSYHYHPAMWGEAPHYSTGRMKSIVLRETALSEHLPVPPSYVAYLAQRPHRFTLRPSPDGASVWVDWNRNGRFDTEPVQADINLDKKISPEPQGDFNDIPVISGYGLSRSLRYVIE